MDRETLEYEMEEEVKTTPAAGKAHETRETLETSRPPRKKGAGRTIVVFGVLALLIAAGTFLWMHSRNRVSTDDAQVDGHIDPISAKISGNVTDVLVDDNQPVKKGQILVKIDPRDYQAKVDQAKAALAVAQSQAKAAGVNVPLARDTTASGVSSADAQLTGAQAQYEQAKLDFQRASTADVDSARSNVNTAQATYDRTQADLARMKPLVDKAEISKLQYDSYVAADRVAASELQASKDKLNGASQEADTKKAGMLSAQARVAQAQASVTEAQASRQQVNVRAADADSARATILQKQADLEAAELNLSYATVVAPIDGVVTRKVVEVGQIIQPGQGLMMVVPLQDVWVTANFKETQLADVRPGQKAEIKADLTGKTYSGHVDSIAGVTGTRMSLLPPENATGNYVKVVQRIPVKILLDHQSGDQDVLRPGMNVDATIFTK